VVQLAQVAVATDYHADRVEANRARRWPVRGLLQPGRREAAQAGALACPQSREGLVLGEDAARADAPGLDLSEHERDAVEGDEVDLPRARSDVVREELKPAGTQVSRGDLLAGAPECASRARPSGGRAVGLRRIGPWTHDGRTVARPAETYLPPRAARQP
jgi:hypothetical protein